MLKKYSTVYHQRITSAKIFKRKFLNSRLCFSRASHLFLKITNIVKLTFDPNYIFFKEKLCKSNMDTWGCYDNCTPTKQKTPMQENTPAQENPAAHSDEECCSTSKRMKSTRSLSREDSKSKPWKPLVLFIPLRLGLSETNPAYYPSLKVRLFSFPLRLS